MLSREKKVLKILGEPRITTKNGREGSFYRYSKCIGKGLCKDIVRKDRATVIQDAYLALFGDDLALQEMTVADVFEEWYKDRQRNKSSKTYLLDLSFWNSHLKNSTLAGMKLASVRAEHIEDALNEICGDHMIARSSLNPLLTVIRGIWSKAVSMGIVQVNLPKNMDFRNIRLNTRQPKSEVQKMEEVYRDDEMCLLRERLWNMERDLYDQAILFLSYLGIRIGEMRAITWEDYDPVSGVLSLNHEIVKRKIGTKNYVDVDVPHTKGYAATGQRRFRLPTPCIQILEELRSVNGDKHYVFQTDGDFPLNPNRLNDHLRKHCAALGIRYFSSHKFRFYWISSAYCQEMNERIIQKVAGHASLEMTRHYNRSTRLQEDFSLDEMDRICGFKKA